MKLLLVGACVLLGFAISARADSTGKVICGATYEGAIFTPQMIANTAEKGHGHWDLPGVDAKAKNTYWMPDIKLVQRGEAALARQYTEAQKREPSRTQDYYTPKYFSRDRVRKVPEDIDDNSFSDWDADLITPHIKRQYIGVTSNGRRLLLMNLAFNDNVGCSYAVSLLCDEWKTHWIEIDDVGHTFVYDIATGKISEVSY